MARLIYSPICSLDGYVTDERGTFDWAVPSEEVFRFINELLRPIGTYLYGRRMYQTMAVWEDADAFAGEPGFVREFGDIWRGARKLVYSRSLERVSSARTTIQREFQPDAVARVKRESDRDITIGGPELAGLAIGAGLVDEIQLFLVPILVGGGHPALPRGVRLPLQLVEQRRFANDMVSLRYSAGTR